MNVTVRNARDLTLVKLLKLAAHSYANNLMPPNIIKNISIRILIKDVLDAGGYCDYDIDVAGIPKEFNIEILKSRKKISMFKVLAHEMVHVGQVVRGEMKDKFVRSKCITSWFGVKYEDVSYWDQPWEIEAYGLENSLVAKFLVEHDLFKDLKQRQADWFAEELRTE